MIIVCLPWSMSFQVSFAINPTSFIFNLRAIQMATSGTSSQAIQVYTNKRKRPREIESGLYRPLRRCLALSNRTAALSHDGLAAIGAWSSEG